MRDEESLVGKIVGNYEIQRELGRGGMGVVYKANEQSLARVVALKVLPAHLSADDLFVKRFQREAKSAARLTHPNIVTVYAVGQHAGMHYIAMEYVKGRTISDIQREQGKFEVKEALELVAQAADALAFAHENDIVHRDIKPQNIMIDSVGRVKVMDFGLAKILAEHGTELTSQGALLGTPKYMSPEQCRGEELDPRTDVFSLGIMFYEMLAGKAPFTAETPIALVRQIIDTECTPLSTAIPGVPAPIEAIVSRMMAKDRAVRYGSAANLVADIRAYLRGDTDSIGGMDLSTRMTEDTDATVAADGPLPDEPAAEPAHVVKKGGGMWKGALAAVLAILLICFGAYMASARRSPSTDTVQGPPIEQDPATAPPVEPATTEIALPPGGSVNPQAPTPAPEATEPPGPVGESVQTEKAPEPGEPAKSDATETGEPETKPASEKPAKAPDPPKPEPKKAKSSGPKAYADGRFMDNGNGTVTDNETGLMWQKAHSEKKLSAPRPGRSGTKSDFTTYDDNLKLAGRSSWRIPTQAELMKLNLMDYEDEPLPFGELDSFWCTGVGQGRPKGGYSRAYAVYDWKNDGLDWVDGDGSKRFYVRCVTNAN